MLRKNQLLFSLLFIVAAFTLQVDCAPESNNGSILQRTFNYFEHTFELVSIDDQITREPRVCDDESTSSPLDEFPEFFSVEQLRQGWVVLHVFGAVYFFVLLATVCNDYFLPTVECICDDLHLSKDIAAATFMATATAMPEFFTNTISTLLTNSDMGLGTIIGSLMFNTLGVAAVAALALLKPIQLDWWPIARDCFIYMFNTVILLLLAWGGTITFTESCIMMAFLILYFLITFNNNRFMPAIRVFVEDKLNCCITNRYDLTEPPENSAKAKLPLKKDPLNGNGLFVVNVPVNQASSTSSSLNLTKSNDWAAEHRTHVEQPDKVFAFPNEETRLMKFWWMYTLPIRFLLSILIPNPITNRKWYPLAFIMCIITIGVNAYLIVWMLTALGVTIGVPDIIMGLTFLAAGSTMPEAVSSIISLRKGESGIGVSNSLGSNSLAILLSLGVPWFIKSCINFDGETGVASKIEIAAQGIEYSIAILIIATISLYALLSMSGYRLTKRIGFSLLSIYLILIILQILLEMNVFFPENCS